MRGALGPTGFNLTSGVGLSIGGRRLRAWEAEVFGAHHAEYARPREAKL
jgi:hypothetical protein